MGDKPEQTIPVNTKSISAGLTVLGVVGAAMYGLVSITTPGEQECQAELADVRVKQAESLGECQATLAEAAVRVELLTEAKDACKGALSSLTRSGQ